MVSVPYGVIPSGAPAAITASQSASPWFVGTFSS